jgi:hypothetical protein
MKAFIIIVILGAAGYFGYQEYFATSDTVKVTGNIQVSQQGNFNINAPQVSGPLYVATVHGTAKNTGSKSLRNVFIKYTIAGKTTSAMIFDLGPGQQVNFTTTSIKTPGKNPPFNLENVLFED